MTAFDGRQQKHHEIYLSDPRRTAPAKLRTVIRQPMTRPVAEVVEMDEVDRGRRMDEPGCR